MLSSKDSEIVPTEYLAQLDMGETDGKRLGDDAGDWGMDKTLCLKMTWEWEANGSN